MLHGQGRSITFRDAEDSADLSINQALQKVLKEEEVVELSATVDA